MSRPATMLMVPLPGAPSWTVAIDMPVWPSGKDTGRPVGWLTTNNSKSESRRGGIIQTRRRKLWREKTYATYVLRRLPRNVGRVHLTFAYAFVNGVHPESSNLGPTTKPIIDALQPYRTEIRKGEPVVFEGIGMIPDDNDNWVVIGPQQPLLPYLGAGSRVGGRVVVTITSLSETLP